jgi:hypothetical protein
LAAAARLADGARPEGRALRAQLSTTAGLSELGIERALSSCLETHATPDELAALLQAAPPSPAAHVLLSGNVFVAALRALALGVAASERVFVRSSRRDPALVEALHALEPTAFERVTELDPQPGDRVWAYGSDETMASVRHRLPAGVWLHAHGHGLGAVVVEAHPGLDVAALARPIALDTALFDQRGCLSPRVVCVVEGSFTARELAVALAAELEHLDQELPPGPKSLTQLAEARRRKDAATYAFEVLDAGSGWVSCGDRLGVPPADRCLHVVSTRDPVATLTPIASYLTTLGVQASHLAEGRFAAFKGARIAALGAMQRPPLDGPVDRRGSAELTRG